MGPATKRDRAETARKQMIETPHDGHSNFVETTAPERFSTIQRAKSGFPDGFCG